MRHFKFYGIYLVRLVRDHFFDCFDLFSGLRDLKLYGVCSSGAIYELLINVLESSVNLASICASLLSMLPVTDWTISTETKLIVNLGALQATNEKCQRTMSNEEDPQ